jgi:type I restriction enzyme S subunit
MQNVQINGSRLELVDVSPGEAQNPVRKKDVLITGSSETPEEVATAAWVSIDQPDVYLNSFSFIYRIEPAADLDCVYLTYWMRSNEGRKAVAALAQGSTRYNISKRALMAAPLSVPPRLEQRAIAAALSDADALLSGLNRLIAKKRDLKQAAMQQLLTGRTRLPGFSGAWTECALGDVCNILKGSGLSRSVVAPGGSRPCVLYGELFTTYGRVINEVVSFTDASDGVLSVEGDVLLPGSTTTVGADLAIASALMCGDVALGGDIVIIRQMDETYNPAFLANYLTVAKRDEITGRTQGITIHHLYGKDLNDPPPVREGLEELAARTSNAA